MILLTTTIVCLLGLGQAWNIGFVSKYALGSTTRLQVKQPVERCDLLTGEMLETYVSITQATKMNGAARNGIRRVIKGQQKSCAGYFWRTQGSKELPPSGARGSTCNNSGEKLCSKSGNVLEAPQGGTHKIPKHARFCYLLASTNPLCENKTYIGVSNNPLARLDQHNGLKQGGAKRTVSGRPWKLVLVIDGFPSDNRVLSFEWIWQNFDKSLKVRKAIGDKLARKMKRQRGIEGRVAMLQMLLVKCPEVCESKYLTIFFSSDEFMHTFKGVKLDVDYQDSGQGNIACLVCGLPPIFKKRK